MAEERQGSREVPFRRVASWTQILRTFLVALDPFKLLIAAFGILATAVGWWLISWVIWNFWSEPNPEDYKSAPDASAEKIVEDQTSLRIAQERFVFMAGLTGDEGESKYLKTSKDKTTGKLLVDKRGMPVILAEDKDKPENLVPLKWQRGRYRVMPWLEDRGPNPWNLTKTVLSGTPEDRGQVLQWFYSNQAPNLVEPLRKFLSPIINLFDSRGSLFTQLYLLLILVWFLLVWAFVGGVITRMAILQLAGKEGGSLRESIQFVSARYWSYFWSPVVPIIMIGIIVLCCVLFGLVRILLPIVSDVLLDGLLFFLPLAAGFVMALLIVGLVGYPLMYATLSAEGSDTFDSLSRSYNYVYESPWTYLWYAFLAILYGAVLIFFVVFMSSFMVYLTKWGLSQTPFAEMANRTTDHLFMYSPTSFGWRELLLAGTPIQVDQYGELVSRAEAQPYLDTLSVWSRVGAGMVGFWLTLIFLMMLGFAYSYFWTVSSMIYLLMRKKVDETEMDEVYLEEEEIEEPIPSGAPMSPPPASTTGGTQMVDAPALRVNPASTPSPAPATPPPAAAATPTPAPASIPVPAPAPEDIGTLAKPNPPKEQPRGDSDPAK